MRGARGRAVGRPAGSIAFPPLTRLAAARLGTLSPLRGAAARGEGRIAESAERDGLKQEATLASVCQNCLGGIADRLDIVSGIQKGNDPAWTALKPFVPPRKSADQ